MRNLLHCIALSLPLLFVATPAMAQAPVQPLNSCESITDEGICIPSSPIILVQGSALRDPVSDAVFPAESINVAPEPGQRVENILRDQPGLQQFRRADARSANPTSQGITLRGIGGNASSRALLLLDGVPQSDPFGGWIAWPGYDALALDSIRIQRGGGSVALGSGAVAGNVELFSADPGNRVELAAAYGSRDSVDAKALLGRELGEGQLTVSASYARSDGFTPIVEGQRGSIDRGARYEQAGVAVRMVAPLSDRTEIQGNIRAFTDDRDRGFDFSDNSNDGADASIRLVHRGRWQWSALGYVQVRSFSSRFGSVADDRNSVNLVLDQYNVPSTGLGARFELRPPVGRDVELRLGGDWRRTEGKTQENFFFQNGEPQRNRRAGGETSTYGLFGETSWRATDQLTLSGGVRLDFWDIADGFRREIELVSPAPGTVRSDEVFADRSGEDVTGRAGFAWQFGDALFLHGSGYLGWRLPTLNELYRPFRVGADATAANELLSPERLKGVEIGLSRNRGDVTFNLTAFYNELDDAIANVTLGQGPGNFPGVGFVSAAGSYRQRQNVDAIRSYGIEAGLRLPLTEQISARAAYSYVDAEVRASGPALALDGMRPAQVPEHSGLAGLEWNDATGNSAGVIVRYAGARFEDDLNSDRLDDALTVDLSGRWQLNENFAVEARAENLFDARIESAINDGGVVERTDPQTFWVGLRATLD